jgi:predicted amidohydrolase
MKLRIAGAQIPVTEDVAANIEAIRRAIDYAVSVQADLLLTPEGSLSGYTPRFDRALVQEGLLSVTDLAKQAKLALALGTCFTEDGGKTYNQLRFYDREGAYLGFHSKTLTCGTWDVPPRGEINDFAVQPLRLFHVQGVAVGGLICNDLWANPECTPVPDPHLTQQLARMGARVILHAVNGGRDGGPYSRHVAWPFHMANLQMRARAAHIWIATVDNSYPPHWPCSAPSGVVAPDGHWAVQAPDMGEAFYVHTLEIAE